MKSNSNNKLKRRILTSILFLFVLAFSVNAQDDKVKLSTEEQAKKEAFERGDDMVIKMLDDNGNEMKYETTRQHFMTVIAKIRDYEKQKKITDRSNNVYILNKNFEFVEVREKKK